MEQLLSMGFTTSQAAEALAATGGKSTLKATDWLLSQSNSQAQAQAISSQAEPTSKSPSPSLPTRKRQKPSPHAPLSDRMRPQILSDVVGQDHLLLDGASLLRAAIQTTRLPSLILWGPPGTGKTSLAKAIANSSITTSYRFVSLSAVTNGVKDVRDAVEAAKNVRTLTQKLTVLFVDEVHRFNKTQQEAFLPVIEDGSIVFMGASTENPSFHLVTPLLSRCQVLKLNSLKPEHVEVILKRAVGDLENGLCFSVGTNVQVGDEVIQFLSTHCDGDARVALNSLETAASMAVARGLQYHKVDSVDTRMSSSNVAMIVLDDVKEALQCKHIAYDKNGEEHYNLISALHKSMRGSDANASIYWLARMLEGGEEPLYIARRLVRFASEDIGLADPFALPQAVACYQACHFMGMPECDVNLSQCVVYLARAPKSVSVYKALRAAQKAVRECVGQNEGVPLHLRNAPTKLMKDFGYGEGYIYPPDNRESAASQSYLPASLQGYKFLDCPNDDDKSAAE